MTARGRTLRCGSQAGLDSGTQARNKLFAQLLERQGSIRQGWRPSCLASCVRIVRTVCLRLPLARGV
jgi:hypothetical protein